MLALLALPLLAQAPTAPGKLDQIAVLRGQAQYDLDWADAEDRMHGTLRPLDPVAGRPVELSVLVGTFQGADFDGPVTLSMRCGPWSDIQTVRRSKGEKGWLVRFVPTAEGDCSLDVGFTTTRHKLLHFSLPVLEAPLPRAPWYVLLVLTITLALGVGVRALFKKEPT